MLSVHVLNARTVSLHTNILPRLRLPMQCEA